MGATALSKISLPQDFDVPPEEPPVKELAKLPDLGRAVGVGAAIVGDSALKEELTTVKTTVAAIVKERIEASFFVIKFCVITKKHKRKQ